MSELLSEWLALREPADWQARSHRLAQQVSRALKPVDTLNAVDLGAGTGSNLRYLMDRLAGRQRWLVVDRDPALLGELTARLTSWAGARGRTVRAGARGARIAGHGVECEIETKQMDLNRLDPEIFESRHLVTASALLDLVSEAWLRDLAHRCRTAGAAVLFAITYNGRSSCDPPEPEDDMVRELMNAHQRTDKGLGGPAAGPDGWSIAERAFEQAGYHVERASSDWTIEPPERAFQRQLIQGWADAAMEIDPGKSDIIGDWLRRRLAHVDAGRSRIVVGHYDMGGWLARSAP